MANDAMLKYIEKDVDMIQDFMNENIGDGRKMTSGDIYEAVKDKLSRDLTKNTFSSSLSTTIKAGIIKGFEGRKRVGYVKVGDDKIGAPPPTDKVNDDEKPKFGIQVTKTIRVMLLDRYNYTRQRYSGGVWHNEGYFTDLGDALKNTSKYLLKNKLRTREEIVPLLDAVKAIEQAEAAVLGELIDKAGSVPLDKKASHMTAQDLTG